MSELEQEQQGGEDAALQLSPAEQASVQKAREGLSEVNPNAMPETGPQRPEWLPEKFWDAEKGEANYENLAKSYGELEKFRNQPKETPEEKSEEAGEPSKDGKIKKPQEEASEAESNPITDLMTKVQSEFGETGEVTEDTIKALTDAGIPQEIVQTYLQGVQVLASQTVSEIHNYVGGEESYTEMSKWAAEQLSDEDLDAFNSALDNPKLRETAVRGLYARYQAANPSEGSLRGPQGSQTSDGDIFKSKEEVTEAMRDPRYQTSPAYRQELTEKLARSQRTGFKMHEDGLFGRRVFSR